MIIPNIIYGRLKLKNVPNHQPDNVGKTMIYKPPIFGNGLYHLFMVMTGGWFTHMILNKCVNYSSILLWGYNTDLLL